MIRRLQRSTLFPYTTLFRSCGGRNGFCETGPGLMTACLDFCDSPRMDMRNRGRYPVVLWLRSSYAFRVMKLDQDRKSTRLNSSHTVISYAVFCLKKKKKQQS